MLALSESHLVEHRFWGVDVGIGFYLKWDDRPRPPRFWPCLGLLSKRIFFYNMKPKAVLHEVAILQVGPSLGSKKGQLGPVNNY